MAGGRPVHYVEDLVDRGSVIRRPDDETTVELSAIRRSNPPATGRSGRFGIATDRMRPGFGIENAILTLWGRMRGH
jgi:hypothetical protein